MTAFLTALLACAAFAPAQESDDSVISVAFVDTQQLIRAHPAGEEIARMSEELDAELEELVGQRQELAEAAQERSLDAEEEELLQALTVTIETRRDNGLSDIREAAAPAEEAANGIIREIAQAEGIALVLDIEAASGLVVFAAETVPDITEAAVELMQERHGDD